MNWCSMIFELIDIFNQWEKEKKVISSVRNLMMFYIDVGMVGRKIGFSFVKIILVSSKKNIKQSTNMVALGKAKRNDEKFRNLIFICLGDNDRRISCRLDNFPTNALIN